MPNRFPLKLTFGPFFKSKFTCGQPRTGFNQEVEDIQLVPAETLSALKRSLGFKRV